jgi:2'-5' RNA ligase
MATPKTLRTFIAFPLNEHLISELDRIQRELKRRLPDRAVRWVRPSSVHLTLFFIGDVLPDRVDPIKGALGVIAKHAAPFTFFAEEVGVFPNPRRPRVLWVGVKQPERKPLTVLHGAVNEAMENLGFKPETRPYHPHLTLGRVRRRANGRDVQAIGEVMSKVRIGRLAEVSVEEVILFQSILKPTGAEYQRLATLPLSDSPS